MPKGQGCRIYHRVSICPLLFSCIIMPRGRFKRVSVISGWVTPVMNADFLSAIKRLLDESICHSGKKAPFLFISISPLKFSKYVDKFRLKVNFYSLGNPYLSYKLDQMIFGVSYFSLKVEKITFFRISKGLKNEQKFFF